MDERARNVRCGASSEGSGVHNTREIHIYVKNCKIVQRISLGGLVVKSMLANEFS
jgi:hypothetical protein